MKRLILFSTPSENSNFNEIVAQIFPEEFDNPKFAFIPANGLDKCKPEYIEVWRKQAKAHNASFFVVDLNPTPHYLSIERQKIYSADIIVISGGNTIELARLLRKNKMISAIHKFLKKPQYVLAGYSAGAIIMTPTIRISPFFSHEKEIQNEIHDMSGLNLVEFEILPHYSDKALKEKLADYRKITDFPVKTLSDSEYLVIDREIITQSD